VKDLTKKIGFIFIPPQTRKIYYIVRRRNNSYYIYDLSRKKYSAILEEINKELKDLYIELGGKELKSFRIPSYDEFINTLVKIGRKIHQINGKKGAEVPEYVVFSVEKSRDLKAIFMIDLRGLDEDFKDIPLAWNHEVAGKGFSETFCFVIGYRDVLRHISTAGDDEESVEGVSPGKISKRVISCPLLRVLREATNSDELINYMARICKRIYRCKALEEDKGHYRMRGTDVLSYVIQSRSALSFVFAPKTEPVEKYTISSTVESKKYDQANVTIELRGFKLELRRYPMMYVGTFNYDRSFWFKSTINDTKAIVFDIDARWLIFHYLYYALKNPYLKLLTALKLLLIDRANGFIPNPARALYLDPRLSISGLRKTIEKYLNEPEKLVKDLNEYIDKLENITFEDKKLIHFIEIIALHTFAHILYLAFLRVFDTDEEEIGLIIEKEHSRSNNGDTSVYPFDEFLDPRFYRYRIIIYEKADSGLGYFDKGLHDIINDLYGAFENLRNAYNKITSELVSYKRDIYTHYYGEIKNVIKQRSYNGVEKILADLEKLREVLLKYSEKYNLGEYTLLPGWLARYAINIDNYKLSSDEKSFIESTMWLILDSLFDLYWDVSPYDLIISKECVYPDLIRYFTLSRVYAVHLLSDLIENYRSPYFVANPLTKKAGEIFEKIKHGSSEHAFYTPWIDKQGKNLIDNILYHPKSREIYVIVREQNNNQFQHPNIRFIALKEISQAPLHAKLYANVNGEIIITSQNLLRRSLQNNIENYSYFIDHILAKALLAFTKTLYNSYHRMRG